jgi:DNA-binding NarL/FixJ family response regulator
MKHAPVRIIVADSEAIFRVGMGKIFALEKELEVVAQTETLQQTLSAVSGTPAEIVLFEAGLSPTPAEAVSDVIRRAEPGTKVIVVAHYTGEEETVEYLRRGAKGILTRSVSPDLLVRCVKKVAAGETWLDNQGVNWVIDAYRTQAEQGTTPKQQLRLSEKEMLIIGGVTQGLKNKDIALEVGTTEQVVKNYLRKIYDKLGVSDRLELALYSMHRRLLDSYVPPASRSDSHSQAGNGSAANSQGGSTSPAPWPDTEAKKQ